MIIVVIGAIVLGVLYAAVRIARAFRWSRW